MGGEWRRQRSRRGGCRPREQARAKGHRGAGQKEGPSWGGQATKGKAGGREAKWGKEEGRRGEGTDGGKEFGVRKQAREGGRGSRQSDRVAQEEKEVEEGVETQRGKRQRERVRESWGEAMG